MNWFFRHFVFSTCSLERRLETIINQGVFIMATLQELNDKIAQVATIITEEKAEVAEKIAALAAQIQALKDQLAAGTLVTQEDLDALNAAVDALGVSAEDITVPDAEPPVL